MSLNQSALIEYNEELNSQANLRDYLMTFTTNLPLTTSNSIKLQSASLAQLTQATNQLTRTASVKSFFLLMTNSIQIKIRYLHQINVINYLLLYLQ